MLKIWMVGGVFGLYFRVYSKVVEFCFVLKLVFALSTYGFSKRKQITFVLKRNLGWLWAGVGGDLFYSTFFWCLLNFETIQCVTYPQK